MSRKQWYIILGVGLLWTAVMGWLQWLKFHAFGYNGLDLAIYDQVVWSLAHGHGFASSIHNPSYLGDHLELWLIPLSWVYKIWPSVFTLLWGQTLILASSIIPLTLLSRRYLSQRLTLFVVFLFLLHPLLYNISLYEFHGLIFALPLLLWSILAYEKKRYWTWLILLVLILAVREDLPFVVIGWAVLSAIDRRGWRWWLPALGLGVLWLIAAQKFIGLHNFVPGYKFLAFYRWMGDSYGLMATFPFRHPLVFLAHVFSFQNWAAILGLVAGFGFLPLFRPKVLWPLVFVFLNILVIEGEPISFLYIHYTAPYIPFLLWASVVAIRDLQAKKIWPQWEQAVVFPLLSISAILGPLYSHLLYGAAQLPLQGWPDTAITPPAILREALIHVQPTDRVVGTFNVMPNLAERSSLYSLNYIYLGLRQFSDVRYSLPTPIDAMVIDWQQLEHYQYFYRTSLIDGKTGSQRIREILETNQLQPVWWRDSVVVYGRASPGQATPTHALTEPTMGLVTSGQKIGPLVLVRTPNPWETSKINEKMLEITWHVAKKIDKPTSIRFTLTQNNHHVWESTRLLGQGAYPADEWSVGQDWRTMYDFVFPKLPAGIYTIKTQVVQLDGAYKLDRWRQFLPFIEKQKILGDLPPVQIRL